MRQREEDAKMKNKKKKKKKKKKEKKKNKEGKKERKGNEDMWVCLYIGSWYFHITAVSTKNIIGWWR